MYRLVRLGPLRPPAVPRSPPRPLPLPAIPRALDCGPRLDRVGLSPPLPLVTLRSAAGSSAKDAGGSPKKAVTDPSDENKKPNKSQQLKQVFKEYGAVGVSFHVGISLVSLGIFYLAVSSGVDMTAVLFKLGFSESSLQSKMAAGTSTFVLAYAVHKLFAPVRISITVVSVPFIVRYCRKIGFFKPPAPNP
ncbi:protein FAM210B, mitochondrial isoform X1 [Accipiter gentilis]|uniref:protein FAM210B, mitochondrial isoform X1 n=1 Tax=Astur gentilis TaxID=8957 RepID=UPI00210F9C70|nr:protein FAM210B, mitochondrial isoform X1 [Accipiter gentilis]